MSHLRTAGTEVERVDAIFGGPIRHGEEFILEGAMPFTLWPREPHREAWDLDLLLFDLPAGTPGPQVPRSGRVDPGGSMGSPVGGSTG